MYHNFDFFSQNCKKKIQNWNDEKVIIFIIIIYIYIYILVVGIV